ncbi:MAG: 5-oxoprolinase [Myxococcales bacterium]|nr:5-oxoprolinase [Myxococcales bacterium]
MPSSTLRIAVDTGGTFTDIIASVPGAARPILTHKLLSTPDDPSRAVLEGIRHVIQHLAPDGAGPPAVVHGSTVATNALLEGKGGAAALITTAGFEDTLHIARQNRPDLYALHVQRPPVPIRRGHCLGLSERVLYDGEVLRPLVDDELEALPGRLRALGVEAVAVSLLHSYANPAHEQQLGALLAEALPDLHVTLSHDLLPEFREYERAATCAVNAVVAPRMGAYLEQLADAIGRDDLRIMGSGGGTMAVDVTRHHPVHTVLSGPAGGVVGALALARQMGFERIITFDMGGTSTDVALCDGALTLTTEGRVGPLPVRVPMIDIHTVGAGGGSIARVDEGGALRVGPESAGAWPGPACYGRSSENARATVTDAHVVLGHLRPERFLGGRMTLAQEAAHRVVGQVAEEAGLDLLTTARGVLQVAEVTMVRAVKVISVERGHDLRDFALFTFGGAGGLHACRLAALLGMDTVLVPRHPGLLSAVGMLFAPCVHNLSRSLMLTIPAEPDGYPAVDTHPQLAQAAQALEAQGRALLDEEQIPAERQHVDVTVAMRYAGQSYELEIPLGPDMAQRFEELHRRLYGTHNPGQALELVVVRARAVGEQLPPTLPPLEPDEERDLDEAMTTIAVGDARWGVIERDALGPDERQEGPLIITEFSSTTLVPEGWAVTLDPHGNMILRHGGAH